jgi:hypothetical protein
MIIFSYYNPIAYFRKFHQYSSSNIKKARYTGDQKLINQKLSVIKVTGTSKNIKQINFILPKEYGIKKIKENLFILFIESKGILATLGVPINLITEIF